LQKVTNVTDVSPEDFSALIKFAHENSINFLIPGPEAPLVAGIVEFFQKHAPEIHAFGPSKAAARMEGSKTFSKDFMKKHNIPTAAYENFNNYNAAKTYLDSIDHDVVIKADGLAAGKGVIIPQTKEEAHAALKEIMLDREFGAAGEKVVIEEYLEGDEISILSFSDAHVVRSLPPAQDHKRIGDGDTGPNTGGMGTYAPTNVVSQAQIDEIERTVLVPTVDGMRNDGRSHISRTVPGLTNGLCRLSIHWLPIHRPHAHKAWPKSARVQRSLRRSRNTKFAATSTKRPCRAHGRVYGTATREY